MGRILSIDYGKKRVGLAVTDNLHISINPLKTVENQSLRAFLRTYFENETVGIVIIGLPVHADGSETALAIEIKKLKIFIETNYSEIEVIFRDESYTSVMAKELILKSGVKKKKRRDKALVDQMSAVIILKQYLDSL